MNSEVPKGLTVLVAEDEYTIATDLAKELAKAGVRVLGPVPSLDAVMELIEEADHIDAAILDVSLQGQKVYPAADMLEGKGIPFLFATGYDQSLIPSRFGDVVRCEKPIGSRDLIQRLILIIAKARL